MEKFITAAGCALRISDSGKPKFKNRSDCDTYAAPDGSGVAGKCGPKFGGKCGLESAGRRGPESAGSEDSGMTIVLLHGYMESLDVWEDFTKRLSPRMRVISLDIPGHGISEVKGEIHTMEFLADVVRDVLESCGVTKCVVCGHLMGGYVALEFLRKYRRETAGIILFHSVPYPDTEEKKEFRRREIEIILAGKKDLIASTTAKPFAPENRKKFAGWIEELADQVRLTDDDGALALLRGMGERRDNNSTLSESAVRQMFIFGSGDEYISIISLFLSLRLLWKVRNTVNGESTWFSTKLSVLPNRWVVAKD